MTRSLLLALLLVSRGAGAQAISTTGVERDTRQASFWRLTYDNDFFTATDRYFTQGIAIEVMSPGLRRLPAMRALLVPAGSTMRYGVLYEDDGYTSSDLKAAQILTGDHPYAGTKQLRVFTIAADSARRQRVTSSLNVGIIGQGAGGAEIQTFIHRHTGNTIPQGWSNQIRNDVILNYEAGIERALSGAGHHFLVTGSASARLGTYNTAITSGITLMVGQFGDPFGAATPRRAFFAYLKPQLNVVGYDATLQGGLFNRTSPYTIAARDLSRLVYRQQAGFVYRSGNRYVEYYLSLGTPEFHGARMHRTGGLLFGMTTGQ